MTDHHLPDTGGSRSDAPGDRLLRDALAAEAEGVEAGEDLWERIRAGAGTVPVRRRRVAPALVAAALVVVIGAVGAMLALGGDDGGEALDVLDQPEPPAPNPGPGGGTDEGPTHDPATTSTTTPETATPGEPGPRPDRLVGVTEDGRLVVVDVETGEELRELWVLDDPAYRPDEGGPFFISNVALHPTDGTAFVELCCEPAAGRIVRVVLDEAIEDPMDLSSFGGIGMDVSSDGRWLAAVSLEFLLLTDLDAPDSTGTRVHNLGDEAINNARVVINHDGTEAAVMRVAERDEGGNPTRTEVDVYAIDGDDLALIETHAEPDSALVPLYTEQGRRLLVLSTQGGPLTSRSQTVDRTGSWVLSIDGDGVARSGALGNEAEPVEIPTELRFLSAAW